MSTTPQPGPQQLPWGAWGPRRPLPPAVGELLGQFLGLPPHPAPPVPLEAVELAPSRLTEAALAGLAAATGPEHVHASRAERLRHTGGRSTTDLLRRRAGDARHAPDAVLMPGSHDEVLGVLAAAERHRLAVVPFGGGTSVTGGVEALAGGLDAVITLDLARMDKLISIDVDAQAATMQAGMAAPRAARLLAARGVMLGHEPQSAEYATIGGFAATRSAGQASAGYGRFDDMVLALRAATPRGTLAAGRAPASAAGPDLRQLLLGSEGAFGVITEVTLAIRDLPQETADEAWQFPGLAAGIAALRSLTLAAPGAVTMARLSDETETSVQGLESGHAASGCLLLVSIEGTAESVAARRRQATEVLREHGGRAGAPELVAGWRRSRFDAPYLRDSLLDAGALAETLETATSWGNLAALHQSVRGALTATLTAAGTPPVVMCHVSHVYRSGASLYFTVVAAQAGDPIGQWAAAKRAASAAILAGAGTITHHHAVGLDHRDYLTAEIGELGVTVLRAVKSALDPAGIMNPGKLIPPAD
ncbi:MAG TPA: FAD-binding oxidoreductase [Streptosporangiaceae bacterium]|jgi:alkyldihydroxyacetonephosphate synthase|nr:FAD-binding oxidoreductase [Streptosporangiaceae bacterium]